MISATQFGRASFDPQISGEAAGLLLQALSHLFIEEPAEKGALENCAFIGCRADVDANDIVRK